MADMAWPHTKAKSDIQPLAYDCIRENTALTSQHAILATHQAAEAISACHERQSKGLKVSKPHFTAPTVTYDTRTMTLFEDNTVSLSTVEGRVRCPLVLPRDEIGYQWQFLNDERWELTESTLTARDGAYYLYIGFRRFRTDREREAGDETVENGSVLGVDVGVHKTGDIIGQQEIADLWWFSRSVERKMGASRYSYTKRRTRYSRKPARTTVRTSPSRT